MAHSVLHINASARHQDSVSRKLSAQIVQHLNPAETAERDLANGAPLLDEIWTQATFTPPNDRTDIQAQALAYSDTLVAELLAADTIVIGSAMYNFNIPASFKAWIDQVMRAGVTFAYTENGPKGMLEGKKVIIALASGGTAIGSELDFATPYLKFAFGFMGITDVTVLDSDGANALTKAA